MHEKLFEESVISLAGEWRIAFGAYEEHAPEAGVIELPGSVTERGFGEKNDAEERWFLTERRRFTGTVTFTRQVELTAPAGMTVLFAMERTRVTRLWVNGCFAGRRDLLTSEQVYDITEYMQSGSNTLTAEVDNTLESVPRDAIFASHMATEHTQTNWTGILGRIELRLEPPIYMREIRVYPDEQGCKAKLRIHVMSDRNGICTLMAAQTGAWTEEPAQERAEERNFVLKPGGQELVLTVPLSSDTPRWSEFSPELTALCLTLHTPLGSMEKTVRFGLRDFGVSEDCRHFTINGKKLFVRGETNCAVFPETGYAPMEAGAWDRLFDSYRAFGVNYVRFHSWCPPEAAFESADRKGLYLQPELCEWTFHAFEEDAEYDYYRREAMAVLDCYGNHPSFVALTWGNELRSGRRDRMSALVRRMQNYDPTRRYAEGSNTWYGEAGPDEASEFVLAQGNLGAPWRGAFAGNKGFINEERPGARVDYEDNIRGAGRPAVSFETGQFQVYPDFREVEEYSGVLEARNLKYYRRRMEANGLRGMDSSFHEASGKLAALCYREEIEAAMRTAGMAGITLLGLQDFPGQGTALVGMMDAFGRPKRFIQPEKFRRFFSPVVPLLRFGDRVLRAGEQAELEVLIHNFGERELEERLLIRAVRANGERIMEKEWELCRVPQGELFHAGRVFLSVPETSAPEEICVFVRIGEYENEYTLFAAPAAETTDKEKRCIVERADAETLRRLKEGECLVLLPELTPEALPESFAASYSTDFWCWAMFRKWDSSGTMGLLPEPLHPLFRKFPTGDHTDPRWWSLLHGARAVRLTGTELPAVLPMIDNLHRNERLAVVFGGRMGRGRLLVCTLNVRNESDPMAGTFRKALVSYALSEDFAPRAELPEELLQRLCPGERPELTGSAAVAAGTGGASARFAVEDNDRCWISAPESREEELWYELRFPAEAEMDTVRISFALGGAGETGELSFDLPGDFVVFCEHGGQWEPVQVLFQTAMTGGEENLCHFEKTITRALRIVFARAGGGGVAVQEVSGAAGRPFAAARIRVYGTMPGAGVRG
ncbi:hypothetical protein [Lachnoclostridium sp. Marseille-P6806]|uniref:hypothetical protein n=1 Tax=Lachnoclostridium sp. Marseille-P6806 TaxID=2364793 RepID=UPI0010321AEC|nr:hypothetical protein [Lachnoclostridium sp. Marseille-P6806]